MGYRARWVAVKAGRLEVALGVLGLRKLSTVREPVYDPGHYGVTMPDGWLIVMGDGWDAMESVQADHARTLSVSTEVLHFYTDDTPMCASLKAFRDGSEVWSFEYDGENGPAHASVNGAPPSVVGEAIERCHEAQRGVTGVDHVYEAAAEIAELLTGFRHDQTLKGDRGLEVAVLAPAGGSKTKRSWFSSLLGLRER